MKKITALFFAAALLFALCLPAAAESGIQVSTTTFNQYYESSVSFKNNNFVLDEALILTAKDRKDLARLLESLSIACEAQIAVVIKSSIDYDIEDYTDDYYDENGYGVGENNTGVLLLVAMDERNMHITTTGDVIDSLQNSIEDIYNDFVNALGDNDDFYSAFVTFAHSTASIIADKYDTDDFDGEINDVDERIDEIFDLPEYSDFVHPSGIVSSQRLIIRIAIAIFVGFALALIITLLFRGKNNSVKFAKEANYYRKDDTFRLTRQNERFLYHTVTRTPIPRDDSPHGGGGGFSGGGVHTGSSGTSHGGGGGHF